MKQFYLQHYIMQSCGLVKIAEYALKSLSDVERTTSEIVARYPADAACFAMRTVNHS